MSRALERPMAWGLRLYLLGSLIAVELLMSFSFLGYLHIAPISITFAYLPILAAGCLLGPLESTILGMVFGLASMWKASASYVMAGDKVFSPLWSGSPLESVLLSVGVRMLFGLVIGLLYLGARPSIPCWCTAPWGFCFPSRDTGPWTPSGASGAGAI